MAPRLSRNPHWTGVATALLGMLLALPAARAGQVYRWTDADGTPGALDADGVVARAAELGVSGWPQRAFLDAARTKSPVTPNFRDAVRAHEIADAVYRSAAQGGSWPSVRFHSPALRPPLFLRCKCSTFR